VEQTVTSIAATLKLLDTLLNDAAVNARREYERVNHMTRYGGVSQTYLRKLQKRAEKFEAENRSTY
jgi:hypothetical protein